MGNELQPKTGQKCTCKRGEQRDNCPQCEGTGWVIDFRAIRERKPAITHHTALVDQDWVLTGHKSEAGYWWNHTLGKKIAIDWKNETPDEAFIRATRNEH